MTVNVLFPTIMGVTAAALSALATWTVERRRASGSIDASEASVLWNAMTTDLTRKNSELDRKDAEIASLRAEIDRLRGMQR